MEQRNSFALPFLVTGVLICATALNARSAFAKGNEGGGGGSSVTCPGRSGPELTDFYEARQANPQLTELLNRLRALDEKSALDYVAEQVSDYLNQGFSGETVENTRQQVRELLQKIYSERNFGTIVDPKDSGTLKLEPGCVEKRVAVNSGFNVYTHPGFGLDNLAVVEEAWSELKPFDRYGLIVHETFYTITEGRISIDSMDPLLKAPKVSQDVRKLVAMILTGQGKSAQVLPRVSKKISCWAGTDAVRRTDSTWDRVHFDISPSSELNSDGMESSSIELTTMWGVTVFVHNKAASELQFPLRFDGSKLLARGLVYRHETNAEPVWEFKPSGDFAPTRTYVSFHPVFRIGNDKSPVVYMTVVRMDQDSEGKPSRVLLMDGIVNCTNPDKK